MKVPLPPVSKIVKGSKSPKPGKTPGMKTRAGAKAGKPAPRAYRKTTAIASLIPELTKKAFEKYGFSAATLLTDWSTIVGPDLAAYTIPEKLKWPRGVEIYGEGAGSDDSKGRPGATLVLRVDGPRAVEIQYKGAQILERINTYFGYRAVSEMRVLQAPLNIQQADDGPEYQKLEPLPQPPPELEGVDNEDLRAALALMAAGIERRRKSRQKS